MVNRETKVINYEIQNYQEEIEIRKFRDNSIISKILFSATGATETDINVFKKTLRFITS